VTEESDMDEFDGLAKLAGPAGPEPETIERHARQLRGAIEAEIASGVSGAGQAPGAGEAPVADLVGVGIGGGYHSWRGAVVAAAAAIVVLLGAVGITRVGDGRSSQKVATSEKGNAMPAGQPGGTSACGDQVPVDILVPVGYDGPRPGPGGDMATAPQRDQHVVHWASAAGAIEVRWPADPDRRTGFDGTSWDSGPAGRPVTSVTFTGEASATPTGRQAKELVALRQTDSSTACSTVQVVVSDAEVGRVDDTIDAVYLHLFDRDLPPLVIGTGEADAAPPVVRCQTPAGVRTPPNQGGPVTDPAVHATPKEALEAFLEGSQVPSAEFDGPSGRQLRQPTIARRGYDEIRLGDGTIAYAKRSDGDPGSFVTVIRIGRADGGWSVTSWEGSGC
jgi:hypothetical protein